MPRKNIIAPRRIEHNEVHVLAHLGDQPIERLHALAGKYGKARPRQVNPPPPRRLGPVLKVAVKRALARIEVNRANPRALVCQRHRDMDRGG